MKPKLQKDSLMSASLSIYLFFWISTELWKQQEGASCRLKRTAEHHIPSNIFATKANLFIVHLPQRIVSSGTLRACFVLSVFHATVKECQGQLTRLSYTYVGTGPSTHSTAILSVSRNGSLLVPSDHWGYNVLRGRYNPS